MGLDNMKRIYKLKEEEILDNKTQSDFSSGWS